LENGCLRVLRGSHTQGVHKRMVVEPGDGGGHRAVSFEVGPGRGHSVHLQLILSDFEV